MNFTILDFFRGLNFFIGTIALDPSSDVGEDGWILEYAMTLAAPQPVQFLSVGNQQIGTYPKFIEIHFIKVELQVNSFLSTNGSMQSTGHTVPLTAVTILPSTLSCRIPCRVVLRIIRVAPRKPRTSSPVRKQRMNSFTLISTGRDSVMSLPSSD